MLVTILKTKSVKRTVNITPNDVVIVMIVTQAVRPNAPLRLPHRGKAVLSIVSEALKFRNASGTPFTTSPKKRPITSPALAIPNKSAACWEQYVTRFCSSTFSFQS